MAVLQMQLMLSAPEPKSQEYWRFVMKLSTAQRITSHIIHTKEINDNKVHIL